MYIGMSKTSAGQRSQRETEQIRPSVEVQHPERLYVYTQFIKKPKMSQIQAHSSRVVLPSQVCARVHFRMAENAVITHLGTSATENGHPVFGVFSKKELLVEPGQVTTFHPGHLRWPTTVMMVVDQGETRIDVRTEGYFRMGGIGLGGVADRMEHQLEIRLRCLHRRRTMKVFPMYLLARVGFIPLHPVAGTIYFRGTGDTQRIQGVPEKDEGAPFEWPALGTNNGSNNSGSRRKYAQAKPDLPELDLDEEDFNWDNLSSNGPQEGAARNRETAPAPDDDRTKVVIERHYYYGVAPPNAGTMTEIVPAGAMTEVVAQVVLPDLDGAIGGAEVPHPGPAGSQASPGMQSSPGAPLQGSQPRGSPGSDEGGRRQEDDGRTWRTVGVGRRREEQRVEEPRRRRDDDAERRRQDDAGRRHREDDEAERRRRGSVRSRH